MLQRNLNILEAFGYDNFLTFLESDSMAKEQDIFPIKTTHRSQKK